METNSTPYQTRFVTFAEDIPTLDRYFDDHQAWGASTLREWVDAYEGTRFTQISERQAVITSQDNMNLVMEWLSKHMPLASDPDRLAITDDVEEVVYAITSPAVNPDTFRRRVQCLMLSGMTQSEAEQYASDHPMKLELFYDIGRGGFAVEAQYVAQTPIYNPYTGKEVPDETT